MKERKEKFTQGPWYIKPREAYETCPGTAYSRTSYSRTTILDKPDGQYSPRHVIATVARGNGRQEANAALIAAAPELLLNLDAAIGQLKDLYLHYMFCLDKQNEILRVIQHAEHALNKAKGETEA